MQIYYNNAGFEKIIPKIALLHTKIRITTHKNSPQKLKRNQKKQKVTK